MFTQSGVTTGVVLFGVLGASLTAYILVTRVLTEPRREQELTAGLTITIVISILATALFLMVSPGTAVSYLFGITIGIIGAYYGILLQGKYTE